MYQGSNLSRTGQMAVSNDQVSNQLKLLKAKMSNRDTWQQGTNQQLDGYPHTQPTKPSQSPLYPKSDYDFYTMKQQQQQQIQSNSQPKIIDPRTLNYQQLQQYKQQQVLPPQNPIRNDPYLGMNAINRLNYYDQLQKYKDDPYKKSSNLNTYNSPQSYYEQQLNKRQQQQQLIQQPPKYYDDILAKKQQTYGYQQNNNYDFTQQPISLQNKNDYMNYNNNNYLNNGLYSNNLQWQNTNQNNLYNNNNQNYNQNLQQLSSQSNQYNQYNLYGNQNINTQQNQQQSSQNQYNYNQNTQSLSPLKQQQASQQLKYSQHNSQPLLEKRDRPFERQYDPIPEQQKQIQEIPEQYNKPQPRKQQQPQQQPSYNQNNTKAFNPIDELPAVAKKNQTNQIPPPEDDDDGDLQECPEGCGRRFKENALDKHIKVCKKVFQSKRKEFNSKAHRQVNQEQAKLEKQGQVKDKIIEKKKQMAQNGDPKWKKQSEAFRQMISAVKQGGTVEIQPQDDLVECPACGRKFSEQAAERHIPGCKKRTFKR
ncbi:unnamed protein product [Paramecium primaurelia]|uniref:C2HC/C3H-type domain-containing protein n=1 Tax=Paramecium primaurelia TaxID=5886 RepID=A0A8S1PMN6_PARPR|nr:unnamed protein product [Paramecium primaurelia]